MSSRTLQDYGGRADTEPEKTIAAMAPWFHNLHLPNGVETAPRHPLGDFPAYKWRAVQGCFPQDLTGWSVLDVGCNAGYYSFALAERGASVLGIDSDERYLKQALWARRQYGLDEQVRFDKRAIWQLAEMEETFDIVLFLGVFYHLRYPLLGLDLAGSKARKLLLFQSLSTPEEAEGVQPADLDLREREQLLRPEWPKLWFIENSFAGDPTNWWIPNAAAMTAMLRSAGLRILDRPAHETYLCEPSGEAKDREDALRALLR